MQKISTVLSMETAAKIIAAPGATIESAGALTYWSLTGETDHAKLSAELIDLGIERGELPPLPSPAVAFYRAVQRQGKVQHPAFRRFVRQSKKERHTYHIVDETEDDAGLNLGVNLKVALKVGNVVHGQGDDPSGLTEQITKDYMRALVTLTHNDVSAWLTKRVNDCDCLSLRPSGGFYFIPRTSLQRWRKIVRALHQTTPFRVFEIPAMPADETVDAVVDAMLREANAEIEQVQADVQGGELGAKALTTRARRCEAMAQKVERYETLLDRRLEDISDKLEMVRAASVAAALVAEKAKNAGS